MSSSLWPHGLQHARLPCSSPSPGVCPSSCRLNWWCHPTISSPVAPFSFCLQSFPASGSFPMNQLFTSGGQSIGASASASVLLNSIQSLFHLRLTGLISLLSKGLLRGFSWMQRSKSPSRIYNVRKARGKWRDSDPFSPSGWLKGLIDTQPALSTCVGGDDDGGKCGVKLRLSYKPVFKEVSPSPSGMEHQVVWHRYFR